MLREQLVDIPETIFEFQRASEDRYWEALSLFTEGYFGGGIYLMGYAAEMLLKAAYFSFRGELLTAPIFPMLAPAWQRGCACFPGSFSRQNRDYHNLDFWSRLLREERRRQGMSLPYHEDSEYQYQTGCLFRTWWGEMRYRHDVAKLSDAEATLEAVNWLRRYYSQLAA